MKKHKEKRKSDYYYGSGNVYKDLGFLDSEGMRAKADLVSIILSIIEKKKWTQEEAAQVLGIPQPKISLLRRGQFSGFSMEKLIKLLSKLNRDIEIVIRKKSVSCKHEGHISVTNTMS